MYLPLMYLSRMTYMPTPSSPFRYFLQGTTAKLSQLLAKRSATGVTELPAHESELASLRRAVALLRQELAACRQQMGTEASAPVTAGLGLPLSRDPSRLSSENAPPRLHESRCTDGTAAAGADAPPPVQGAAGAAIPGGEDAAGADGSPATGSQAGGGSAFAPISMVRSVSATLRTPHGYVDGAICVEFPRRQRVRTSSAPMPRSSSTVGMSRPLPGIPMSRSPTAPAATRGAAGAQKTEG